MRLKFNGRHGLQRPAVWGITIPGIISAVPREELPKLETWGWNTLPELTVCVNNIAWDYANDSTLYTCRDVLRNFGYLMSSSAPFNKMKLTYVPTSGECHFEVEEFPESAMLLVPAGWGKTLLDLVRIGVQRVAPHAGENHFLLAHSRMDVIKAMRLTSPRNWQLITGRVFTESATVAK
jgi:hypothetical protein